MKKSSYFKKIEELKDLKREADVFEEPMAQDEFGKATAKEVVRFLKKAGINKEFCNNENKIKFVKSLDLNKTKKLITRINGLFRFEKISDRKIDGEGIYMQDNRKNSFFPPLEKDKDEIIELALKEAKKMKNTTSIAFLFANTITALQLFENANKRVSRFVYNIFREDYLATEKDNQILEERIGKHWLNEGYFVLNPYISLDDYIWDILAKKNKEFKKVINYEKSYSGKENSRMKDLIEMNRINGLPENTDPEDIKLINLFDNAKKEWVKTMIDIISHPDKYPDFNDGDKCIKVKDILSGALPTEKSKN